MSKYKRGHCWLHHLVSSSSSLKDTKSAIPFLTRLLSFCSLLAMSFPHNQRTKEQPIPNKTHSLWFFIIPFFNHSTHQFPTTTVIPFSIQDFISEFLASEFGSDGLFMKNPLRFSRQWRFLSFFPSYTKGLLWLNPLLCYRDFRFSCHRLLCSLSLLQPNHWLPKSSAIFVVASCFEFTRDYLSSSLCPSFTSFFPTLVVLLFSSCLSYFSSPSLLWFFSILQSLVSLLRFVCFLFDRPQLTLSHLLLRRRLFPMFVGRLDRNPSRRNGWCLVLGWEFTVMGMFTRGNFIKGGARVVGFITTIWVEGMKAIGLMRNMMVME